ncbi:MAG: (E)-4-hydroxy-3-methylbut-2-enyl-diphosphate synthase [Paludibacteraceae bacterium]|nr:(E)-4-hydroxy-3-methylbut-2-enyl-diphosphate synthase [Paludibacteraceae bacterium]
MHTNYNRRDTKPVFVGGLQIGGNAPIRVQSMLNTSTNDTESSVAQAVRIIKAGGEMVRLTTQGEREAANMANVRAGLNAAGYSNIPLVADVHFNPKAAFEAAKHIEKVRINPGNFAQTLEEADEKFTALLGLCKKNDVAIRLGVNHGSLSKRIMNKYGDTPEGMVESCMEYLRICKRESFNNVVISVKASNVRVMVHTVRLMAATMDAEGLNFPLHLGVTEAGNDYEGRVKSAVGIGTLLADGIGDTIRVSLSEAPEKEIPVAKQIVKVIEDRASAQPLPNIDTSFINPYKYIRRNSIKVGAFGGGQVPEILNATDKVPSGVLECELKTKNAIGEALTFFSKLNDSNDCSPVVISRHYGPMPTEELIVRASCELGPLFIDGLGDGLRITADGVKQDDLDNLMLTILQAARARMSKTEYISCPSCGRTLFDIEGTIAKIKAATSGYPNLKIGIMGCIVNGPGEMADADFGYVGAAPGKISLYKGQTVVRRNIPQEEAVEALVELIEGSKG